MDIIRNCVLILSVAGIVATVVVFVIWYATSHASHEHTMKALKKTLIFVSIFVGLTILCVLFPFLMQAIDPNYKEYQAALKLKKTGKYFDAIPAFLELSGYKDCEKQIEECKREALQSMNIGDIIEYGSYEQDNNMGNGTERIEWIVLDKTETSLLLISKYALDCQPYNESLQDVTWETCTLRKWLNESFYSESFTSEEKSIIASSAVSESMNLQYDTPSGNNTTDKVFLLSILEAYMYFNTDVVRQCKGTEYCYARKVLRNPEGYCWWWLRSPGSASDEAAHVSSSGYVNMSGSGAEKDGSIPDISSDIWGVSATDNAVRPAMWIELST